MKWFQKPELTVIHGTVDNLQGNQGHRLVSSVRFDVGVTTVVDRGFFFLAPPLEEGDEVYVSGIARSSTRFRPVAIHKVGMSDAERQRYEADRAARRGAWAGICKGVIIALSARYLGAVVNEDFSELSRIAAFQLGLLLTQAVATWMCINANLRFSRQADETLVATVDAQPAAIP